MSAQEMVKRVAAAYAGGHQKTATFPPFSKNGPPPPPTGVPTQKRNIPQDHQYDPKALKPMAKTLWAASVALGHALTAYRHLSRLKSTTVSPDGMLGGRGYVMPVKDARQKLFDACENLSSIADTLHDEITGPHWKSKLAQLDDNDAEDVERFVEESQEILDNPEDEAEKDLKAIEEENDKEGDEPKASKLPGGGAPEESEAQPPSMSGDKGPQGMKEARIKAANSSLPVESLPGPRVDSLDRAEQLGPWGSYNLDERPSDNWDEGEHEPLYHYEGENDYREAQSTMPEDGTPTDAWDFGIGMGAGGSGAGGYENPSDEGSGTKGVWGPHSVLPGTPAQSVGDSTPVVDVHLNERHALIQALLPGDTDEPVARSDYYPGAKGNLVQAATPWGLACGPMAESELPQEEAAPVDHDVSLVDTGYVHEDVQTPYARYDYTTHNYRADPLHNWPSEG